jgi:hypothetical protein
MHALPMRWATSVLDPAREPRSSQFRKTYAEAAGASTNANAYIAANARHSHLVARIVCVAPKNPPIPSQHV